MEYSFKQSLSGTAVANAVSNQAATDAGWRINTMGPQANSNGLFWILWERPVIFETAPADSAVVRASWSEE